MRHKEGTKSCRRCEAVLPIEAFQLKLYRRQNAHYRDSYCKDCNREMRTIREEKTRRETQFRVLQQRIGEPPCTGCLMRPTCAVTGWSCDRYKVYLETGKA